MSSRKSTHVDLTGKTIGRVSLIKRLPNIGSTIRYSGICSCGTEKVFYYVNIAKAIKNSWEYSCGCAKKLPSGESCFNSVYLGYKCKAKNKGIIFNVSIEDFRKIIRSNCFYCDSPPMNKRTNIRANGSFNYNGIDRVDNNQGYIEGNIVPCCKKCNKAKLDMELYEFYEWIEKVYEFRVKEELIKVNN